VDILDLNTLENIILNNRLLFSAIIIMIGFALVPIVFMIGSFLESKCKAEELAKEMSLITAIAIAGLALFSVPFAEDYVNKKVTNNFNDYLNELPDTTIEVPRNSLEKVDVLSNRTNKNYNIDYDEEVSFKVNKKIYVEQMNGYLKDGIDTEIKCTHNSNKFTLTGKVLEEDIKNNKNNNEPFFYKGFYNATLSVPDTHSLCDSEN